MNGSTILIRILAELFHFTLTLMCLNAATSARKLYVTYYKPMHFITQTLAIARVWTLSLASSSWSMALARKKHFGFSQHFSQTAHILISPDILDWPVSTPTNFHCWSNSSTFSKLFSKNNFPSCMLILKTKIYQICYGLTSGFKLVSFTVSRLDSVFEFGTTC